MNDGKFYGVTAPAWETDAGLAKVLRAEAESGIGETERDKALLKTAADRIAKLAAENRRLRDSDYLWFLRGFCSSTADFNGDTHGHDPEQQFGDWHADNFQAWQQEDGADDE